MVRSVSHVVVSIDIHCWAHLMTRVKLLTNWTWRPISNTDSSWIICLLSFISWILWYYIIRWTTLFECMRIQVITIARMIGAAHTQILSVHLIRSVNLEITIVRILLRWLIRLLGFIFISCVVVRSYILVHAAYCLVVLLNLLFTNLVMRLDLILAVLLLMMAIFVFYRGYYSMSILIITHYSPRRLRWCSFITLVIKHIRAFMGIWWLLLVVCMVRVRIMIIVILVDMPHLLFRTCKSFLLIIMRVFGSIYRLIVIMEVMTWLICILNCYSIWLIVSLRIIIHSCCLRCQCLLVLKIIIICSTVFYLTWRMREIYLWFLTFILSVYYRSI